MSRIAEAAEILRDAVFALCDDRPLVERLTGSCTHILGLEAQCDHAFRTLSDDGEHESGHTRGRHQGQVQPASHRPIIGCNV